jgi:prevent-host-death family protein
MPAVVNVREAKAHLSKLLERVSNGDQIIIARAGKPVALLSPYTEQSARRVPGVDAGKIVIAPDFDAPLAEFEASDSIGRHST